MGARRTADVVGRSRVAADGCGLRDGREDLGDCQQEAGHRGGAAHRRLARQSGTVVEVVWDLGPVITDRRFSVTAAVNNELILMQKCDYVLKTPGARVRLAPFDYVVAFPCVSVCGYPVAVRTECGNTRVW